MSFISRLRRRIQKKFYPTERDLVMRRWKRDAGDKKLRVEYALNRDSIVMDLGGFEGNWASEIYERYGCRVFVFEPVQEYAESITQRFQENSNIQIFPYGLAGTTRQEQIGLCSDSSSMFITSGQTQEIELVDAADWFSQHPIADVALMKINIEGGEYELLDRLIETGLVKKVRDIQVQFHDISPDSLARMKAIQQSLQATHSPTWQYQFVWENWRRRE